jgi:mercuric ion transport protein
MIRERLAAGGAVAAAFASCLCCVGPLAAVGLGIGAYAGAVEPLRPYLVAASAVALGFGFRQAYFRPSGACAEDGTCRPRRASFMTRAVLWIAALAVVVLGAAPYAAGPLGAALHDAKPANSGGDTAERAAAFAKATLDVKGMTCAGCEMTVRLALERTPGVGSASVSFERGEAVVDYDPARVTPDEVARELARATGAEAAPKEER